MNEEKMITTYKEFEESIKNGDKKLVKGLGRLLTYQGLEYIKELLINNYSEELEDSFVAISAYIDSKEEEINKLKEVIEETMGNINELIEHYKRLLNAEYNQEISVFVDKIHKNMFISNVVSSLEVMKICILDKAGDSNE